MLPGGQIVALLQKLTALRRRQPSLSPAADGADCPAVIGDSGDCGGIAGTDVQCRDSAVAFRKGLFGIFHFFLRKQTHLNLFQCIPEGMAHQIQLHPCKACIMKKLVLRSRSRVLDPM